MSWFRETPESLRLLTEERALVDASEEAAETERRREALAEAQRVRREVIPKLMRAGLIKPKTVPPPQAKSTRPTGE